MEINVFDMDRLEHVASLMPATQFTILEQVTYGGVANLFLTGSRVDDVAHPIEDSFVVRTV